MTAGQTLQTPGCIILRVNSSVRADVLTSREQRQRDVVAALSQVLPGETILFRHEDTAPFECDALTAYRTSPLVVVLPHTEAQVAAVLKTCHYLGVPVVARGAGTGLSGGATPHQSGVILSLAKFNKILKIDAASCTAIVQCGVRNLAISEAAAAYGLYYAPDPSSQIACTIGGNVAENSGGVHCLKYGLTLHNVLRVRGFMVDGEPVEFGSQALDAPGLDLLSVIVGSEGMLAVTTEVTVKLIPKPLLARCIMASFSDIESAGAAVASVIAHGIIPAGLEMMDRAMTAAVDAFVHADYDLEAAAILLCESDGTPEEVEEEIAHMEFSFSTPTPCSPVTVPPSRTLVSKISAPNNSQRRISSGSAASNKINGCKLPSPAWKTFTQRRLYLASICWMARSISAKRLRGMVESMHI